MNNPVILKRKVEINMLIFTYDKASIDIVIETFIVEFAENMRSNKLTTVPCNYYDDNLEKNLMLLVNKTDNGFVFDENDEIGVEPYGYISDFFECYMHLLQRLKMQFCLSRLVLTKIIRK